MAETNYTVDEKDTVAGRLSSFTDYKNPALRRVASIARGEGAARGMSNSSITIGNAIGKTFDVATDVAKADSSNIISTKMQNAINNTSMRNTDVSAASNERMSDAQNATSVANTLSQTTSNEKVATAQNATSVANTLAQTTSNEKTAAEQNATSKGNAILAADTQKQVQAAQDKAAAERLAADLAAQISEGTAKRVAEAATAEENRKVERERIASLEKVSVAETLAKEKQAALEAANAVNLANVNAENLKKVDVLREKYAIDTAFSLEKSTAWNNYQQSIANIDTNASATSQTEQFNRASDAFDARMGFIDDEGVKAITKRATESGVTNTEAYEVHRIALQRGTSAAEIDAKAGLPPGSTAAWVEAQGLPALK